MRYLFALSALLYCGEALAQQYPVCSFKMYSALIGETPLTHTQQIAKTFPLYQSASFNWGLPFINKNYYPYPYKQLISDAEITQLLDSAAAHNINIILPDVVSRYAATERFYLDASSQYFNTINGVIDADGQAEHPSVFYDNGALRSTVADGYMVKDVKIQPVHPWFPTNSYRAYFRLKASRPPGYKWGIPIVDIEVFDVTSGVSLFRKAIKNEDFDDDDWYQTFEAGGSFTGDGNSYTGVLHQIDLRVKWYGNNTTVWLDNIRIEGPYRADTDPATLFSGGYDAAIKTAAKKFNAHPALARFYLSDEPCITMYLAYDYVNKLLKIADQENGVNPNTGKGLAYVAKTQDDPGYGTYSRFTQEAKPRELATDIYRFYKNDPLPSDPNYTSFAQSNALQSAIYHFKLAQQSSIYSETGTWQYFPNISRFTDATREPYLAEVYAQVNLALAYGAKGVHYFHYWTVNDGHPDFPIGLIDPATLDPINSASQYSIYHENKWDGIKSLNQKLAGPLGTTLMNLTWQNAYSMHLQPSLAGTYITSVITTDAANERYVELGLFKDPANKDCFMLVNRRTKSNESRNISVVFNNVSMWGITDVATGETWIIPPNGSIMDNLSPGEGKLYRINPPIALPSTISTNTTWSGPCIASSNVTIVNNATLTIDPGTEILLGPNVKIESTPGSKIFANGTENAVIHFGRLQSGQAWDQIHVSGWKNRFTYCCFDGGSYADVFVHGGSENIFTSCTFKNAVSCGLKADWSSGNVYANCLFLNNATGIVLWNSDGSFNHNGINWNTDHGLCIYYATITNFINNVIENNGGYGIVVWGATLYMGNGTDMYYLGKDPRSETATYGAGRNRVYNNGSYQLYVDVDARLWVGALSWSIPTYDYYVTDGFNKVSSSNGHYIYNLAMTYGYEFQQQWMVPASKNFWGGSVGYGNFYGSVDFSYPLSNDPTIGIYGPPIQTSIANQDNSGGAGTVLTSMVAAKLSANESTTSQQQSLLNLKNKMLEVRNSLSDPKNRNIRPRLIGYLNALRLSDANDVTQEKRGIDVILADYRERLVSGQIADPTDRLCSEAALVNEVRNATLQGDLFDAKDMLKRYSKYVRNDDNKRALFLSEVAIEEGLGEYTQAMLALHKAKQIQPDSRQKKKYVEPPYDVIENILKKNAQEAGKTIDEQQILQQLAASESVFLENNPNPFNPTTVINYRLPVAGRVSLKVYDILGREVVMLVDDQKEAGFYTATFDGSRFSSGVYFARFLVQPQEGKQIVQVKKMLMIK